MVKDFLFKYHGWYLIIVLIFIFILRIPSWFEPYWYGDEGITLTMGQAWRSGLVIYRDIHDNKPPLLYLLAGIAYNLFWFKIILTIWVLLTISIFWKLTRKINQLLNLPTFTNIITTAIFSLLITVPAWEGNLVNGEIFMLAPIIIGMYLIITKININKTRVRKISLHKLRSLILGSNTLIKSEFKWLFIAGVFFSLGFLFKHPAATDLFAVIIFIVFLLDIKQKNYIRVTFFRLVNLLAGFVIPILIGSVIFLALGGWRDFVQDVFLNNLIYVSVWVPKASWGSTAAFGGTLFQRLAITLIITLLLWVKRQQINQITVFVMLWFIWGLFGALLSGRPYPHYLLQIIPSLSIIMGWLLISIAKIKSATFKKQPELLRLLGLSIAALLLFYLGWARIGFNQYPVVSYYRNFISYVSGTKSSDDYFQWFDPRVPGTYRLAAWIKSHTLAHESIFVWSDDPLVYPLAQKLPATSYIAAYHINQYQLQDVVIAQLKQNPPSYIIKQIPASETFPKLDSLINQQYRWVKNLDRHQVYHLRQV